MPNSAPKSALLVDGNALIHRAWHALPPLTAPDGRVVNAVYGFASVFLNLLKRVSPDVLVVCWDREEPTYRHDAEPEYKAGRVEQPDEFYAQFPLVHEIVEAFGAQNMDLATYEADDLLATLAKKLAAQGTEVSILTSDRDIWQVIGPHVRVLAFKKGVSETVVYDEKMLKEVTGLTPSQIADFKAMRGDSSDNLKGIPGIGEKTGTELLLRFSTLEGVLKAAKDPKTEMSDSLRKKIVEGEEAARKTLHLVTLMEDAPLPQKLSELTRKSVDTERLRELFLTYGFKSLLPRLTSSSASIEEEAPKVERTKKVSKSKNVSQLPATAPVLSGTLKDAEELSTFLKTDALIIYPLDVAQGSLFAETPALALGANGKIGIVTTTLLQNQKATDALKEVCEDESIRKIGHGLKEAWHWCREREIDLKGIQFDTEIASYLLGSSDGGHDLPSLAASKLGVMIPENDPGACVDAIRQLEVQLQKELETERLAHIWERFEKPLLPVLGEMEDRGILIDRPYFKTLADDFREVRTRLETEMVKLAGESFNPASPNQLAHILFEVLKLPTKGLKRGKTGISTAASELEKLEGTHAIIAKVGEYREVAKLLSTYVETLPEQTDAHGRVHTTYVQIGAATGRMSSTNPNLQNIPIRTELGRKIRRGFIAEKGHVLLSCDYSQIELRVIAALAKDEKMLEAFQKNLDIHTATAAAIWHIPLEEVSKDQRRSAKAINFGIIYGQGPQGLAKAANVPYAEAKMFIEEYFHVYSGIREYLDQTKALAHAQGFVETLFGRRRPIPEINSPMHQLRAAAERMAINMPVQGTATGDLIKLAIIALDRDLPKTHPNVKLLLQVHDEVVFEVPEKEVESATKAIKEIMENVESIGVPLVVDAKVGKNWDVMEIVAE
jgi:DNA polymerase-1